MLLPIHDDSSSCIKVFYSQLLFYMNSVCFNILSGVYIVTLIHYIYISIQAFVSHEH